MANKKNPQQPLNRSQRLVKFIKGLLWSFFVAILLGVALNMVFLKSIRRYTQENLQLPPSKTQLLQPNSSNRVIRFSSALLFARQLQRTQAEPLVCRAICNPSQYQFQDVESPLADAVIFYNKQGLSSVDDFNFSLGIYVLNIMADLFPKATLDAFESSTRVESWSSDLALSVKMQFDIFDVSGDLKNQLTNFKSRLDTVPDLAELNMLCQNQRISVEEAQRQCLQALQIIP